MTETKREKFVRLATARGDVAYRKIELMQNLGRSDYEISQPVAHDIVKQLRDAVDGLSKAWKVPRQGPMLTATDVRERQAQAPAARAIHAVALAKKADGGATIDHEIRWAIDLIRRGSYDIAESRLKRCLENQKETTP